MRTTWWKDGDWSAICDVCGFKYKASTLKERWDGLMVCSKDWEMRHPQEMIRPIPDMAQLPWTRPEAANEFIGGFCTLEGRQAVAGFAVAGCAIAGANYGVTGTLSITSNG